MRCLAKAGSVRVVTEGRLVFFKTRGEPSAGLSDICLMAVGAGEFVYSRP